MIPTLLLALAQALPGAQAPAPTAPVKDLLHLPPPVSDAELRQVLTLLTDVDDHALAEDGQLIAYATDAEQALLREAGIPFAVQIEDLTAFYADRLAADLRGRTLSVGSMGGWRTLAEIEQEMDRLAATYPLLCSPKFPVGTSIQGRTIWAMRISTTPTVHDPAKAVAWYDGMHHAREVMSPESLLMFADELLTGYGVDALMTRLVETRNLVFIPCVNPDGYEYNRQIAPNGGGLWRKNRRNNGGGDFGVDLNRNYSYEWGPQWSGSSSNPASDTYRGTGPLSEPETAAVAAMLATMVPGISQSVHTYSDLMLFPWGYDTVITVDDARFQEYGDLFTAENGWPAGTVWELLYTANGGSTDYHYATHDTFAFTPEIGSQSDGFWPVPSRIPALYQAIRPTYVMTAMWTGGYAEAGGLAWTEVAGDGDAWREPGETWQLALDIDNRGVEAVQVVADLASTDAFSTAGGGPLSLTVPAHGSAPALFTVVFAADAPVGQALGLELSLDFDGFVDTAPLEVFLGRERRLLFDDLEDGNFGWQPNPVSSNWAWELANPQGTSSSGQTVQPENDATPGAGTRCWVTGAAAGSSAGTNDVDGTAVLTSPRFDLSAFGRATLGYQRWFANLPGGPLDDRFLAEVSADGGATWTVLENVGNRNSWQTVSFELGGLVPLTDDMRLRVTVADDPNDDLTEGLLDGFFLDVTSELPTLGLWGEGTVGSDLAFQVDGEAGAPFQLAWSAVRTGGSTLPGIAGTLELAGPTSFASGTCGTDGRGSVVLNLPSSVGGRTLHFQSVVDLGSPDAALSNAVTLDIP
jgi:hypothetical protein